MLKFKRQTGLAVIFAATTVLVMGCQSSAGTKADPKKAVQIRTELAAQHINRGELDIAKRTLDQALELNSRDSTANMMMGVLLQREGSPQNFAKAERYFKQALSTDSKNPQARNNYGTYLYQAKRYQEALQQFNIAGATLGYDQRWLAIENAGRVYLELGDTANAEKSFTQALHVNRDAYNSMIELANILYLRGDVAGAGTLYDQAVKLIGQQNQNARALWVGIRLARAHGNPFETQALVNQLRALYPESPEYQRYLQLQYTTEAVWK